MTKPITELLPFEQLAPPTDEELRSLNEEKILLILQHNETEVLSKLKTNLNKAKEVIQAIPPEKRIRNNPDYVILRDFEYLLEGKVNLMNNFIRLLRMEIETSLKIKIVRFYLDWQVIELV